MLEDGKITSLQIIYIMFISRIILTLTYLPALTAPPENQDIWISDLLMYPIQLIMSIPIYLLWRKFPKETIIQYSKTIAGCIAGKVIGVLYVWFFLHYTAITLSQVNVFYTSAIMPETPALFFAITIIFVCAYTVRKGIEVIGRFSEIITPVFIIAIISIVLLLAKDIDFKNLSPVLEKGIFPVIHGAVTPSARTIEILGIAMILPYLNDKRKAKSILLYGFALMIIFFLIIDISTITVLGVEFAKNRTFPFYSAVGLVNVGNFLERIESIHIGIWTLGVFLKVCIYYYLAVLGMGQLFELKDYRPIVLPAGTIIVSLSVLIAPNLVELREFTSYEIFTWYTMLFILLIPCILLVATWIRSKGGKQI